MVVGQPERPEVKLNENALTEGIKKDLGSQAEVLEN
jgi:hypothetical protein